VYANDDEDADENAEDEGEASTPKIRDDEKPDARM
jgi:hypothetical protein